MKRIVGCRGSGIAIEFTRAGARLEPAEGMVDGEDASLREVGARLEETGTGAVRWFDSNYEDAELRSAVRGRVICVGTVLIPSSSGTRV